MWQFLVLTLYVLLYPLLTKSAWVEIPQVPNNKPSQFVFGTPKVSFVPTTPTNHRRSPTTSKPSTTTPVNYKAVMTTIIPTTSNQQKNQTSTSTKKQSTENTYSTFETLLNSIQKTLTANAKKSLKSKMSILTNLRDTLLVNIDERMRNLWKRSDESSEARGHDEHEMDFPSNEGALMTIGFLTFAVFLIKLVLKLIHALKDKTNMMVVTSTAAPTAFIGKKKREVENENLKILQLIDEYNFG